MKKQFTGLEGPAQWRYSQGQNVILGFNVTVNKASGFSVLQWGYKYAYMPIKLRYKATESEYIHKTKAPCKTRSDNNTNINDHSSELSHTELQTTFDIFPQQKLLKQYPENREEWIPSMGSPNFKDFKLQSTKKTAKNFSILCSLTSQRQESMSE